MVIGDLYLAGVCLCWQDFKGLLDDLTEWELSLKGKDGKLKSQAQSDKKKSNGLLGAEKQNVRGSSAHYLSKDDRQHPLNYDAVRQASTNFLGEESSVDAVSEKELGNEYFKQKKFNEAIDSYSRSIALSPSSVAYSNRAMAYIKIKRFQEAEEDCTEALNLDDRNIKAYSRRATARKELGKLRESLEDAEFALRLEPQNGDVKKQFNEIKSLLGKEVLQKSSKIGGSFTQGVKQIENRDNSKQNGKLGKNIHLVPTSGTEAKIQIVPDKVSTGKSVILMEMGSETMGMKAEGKTPRHFGASSSQRNNKNSKQLGASVETLASRAASQAMQEAAKRISPPNSAFEFEISWKGFLGDCSLQARLLKVTPPDALPRILKHALSAPMLMEIVKCISTFFMEDTELAVKHLENLTKVSRFDLLIMCLPLVDKGDLSRIWDEMFMSNATPVEYVEVLSELRPKYCPRR